jgi:flagellar hook-length control protein FliK
MQNPITFLPAESSGNAAKQVKSNTSQPVSHSFNQVLSKEISNKKNTSSEASASSSDNKQSADGMEVKNEKSDPQIKSQEEKDSATEKKQASTEVTSIDSAQFIFFVENVAQYSSKVPATPSDATIDSISIADVKTIDPLLSLPGGTPLSASEENKPKLELIASAVRDIKNKSLISSMPTELSGDALTESSTTSTSAEKALIDLKSGLKAEIKPEQKFELKTEIKTELKPEIKVELKPEQKIELKPELKAELKPEFRIQAQGSEDEASLSRAEITLSAQNVAQRIVPGANQINGSIGTEHLPAKFGSPAWDQAIGQKVIWMVAGGRQTAELSLNPPDLGPLKVVLSVSNDQASANFFSSAPEVREALESALPRLRQMMNDAGIQLSGFSVNSNATNQGNQFNREHTQHASSNTPLAEDKSVSQVTSPVLHKGINKEGIVDTYA